MKILVMSDSHGDTKSILKAIQREMPDMVLHLGDYDKDAAVIAKDYPDIPYRVVRGNCDYMSFGPQSDEFAIEGKRFYMVHGHQYRVKTGLSSMINDVLYRDVDVLLFGHTHVPYYSTVEGLTILNPGNIGMYKSTYAILECKNGELSCEIMNI